MTRLFCVFWRYWCETGGRMTFIDWAGREMRRWLEGSENEVRYSHVGDERKVYVRP